MESVPEVFASYLEIFVRHSVAAVPLLKTYNTVETFNTVVVTYNTVV